LETASGNVTWAILIEQEPDNGNYSIYMKYAKRSRTKNIFLKHVQLRNLILIVIGLHVSIGAQPVSHSILLISRIYVFSENCTVNFSTKTNQSEKKVV